MQNKSFFQISSFENDDKNRNYDFSFCFLFLIFFIISKKICGIHF